MKSDSCGNHCANDAKIEGGDRENEAECGCTPCGQPKACLGDRENAMTDALESTETASARVPYQEGFTQDSEGAGVVKNDSRVDGREAPSKAGFWWVEYKTGLGRLGTDLSSVLVEGSPDNFDCLVGCGDALPLKVIDIESSKDFVAWRGEALPLNKMSTEKLIEELKFRGVVQGELVDTVSMVAEIESWLDPTTGDEARSLLNDLKEFILSKKG